MLSIILMLVKFEIGKKWNYLILLMLIILLNYIVNLS